MNEVGEGPVVGIEVSEEGSVRGEVVFSSPFFDGDTSENGAKCYLGSYGKIAGYHFREFYEEGFLGF